MIKILVYLNYYLQHRLLLTHASEDFGNLLLVQACSEICASIISNVPSKSANMQELVRILNPFENASN